MEKTVRNDSAGVRADEQAMVQEESTAVTPKDAAAPDREQETPTESNAGEGQSPESGPEEKKPDETGDSAGKAPGKKRPARTFVVHTGSMYTEDVRRQIDKSILKDNEEIYTPEIELLKNFKGKEISVTKKMFPGYLFIDSDEPTDLFLRIRFGFGKKIFKYCTMLRNNEYILPISAEERERIDELCGEKHVMSSSTGYIEGNKVIITDGPLKGHTGSIIKINRHKKTALVESLLLGETRPIVVGLEIIKRFPDDEEDEKEKKETGKEKPDEKDRDAAAGQKSSAGKKPGGNADGKKQPMRNHYRHNRKKKKGGKKGSSQ